MMDAQKAKIVLADNDDAYRRSTAAILRLTGCQVLEANSLETATALLERERPALAILDIRLTEDADSYDTSGLEAARAAQSHGIPCIIITAFPSTELARSALRAVVGPSLAVDFVDKAHGPTALLDAVHMVLARPAADAPEDDPVDLDGWLSARFGQGIRLSRLQYALLACLFAQPGAVCSQREIYEAVYGERLSEVELAGDRRLELLVSRVRAAIERDPRQPRLLLAVPGRGYRLVRDPD